MRTLNQRSPFPVRPVSDYSSRSKRLRYFIGLHYNDARSIVNHNVHPTSINKGSLETAFRNIEPTPIGVRGCAPRCASRSTPKEPRVLREGSGVPHSHPEVDLGGKH